MRFNYKEIADYKFIFDDGTEIILDTLIEDTMCMDNNGTVTFIIKDALVNKEMLEKLYTNKVKKVFRILNIRDEKSGKDLELSYILKDPTINYHEINEAEGVKYVNPTYTIAYYPTFTDSRTKFEIQ